MTTLSHVPRRRGFLSALLAALAGALALAS